MSVVNGFQLRCLVGPVCRENPDGLEGPVAAAVGSANTRDFAVNCERVGSAARGLDEATRLITAENAWLENEPGNPARQRSAVRSSSSRRR